MSKFTSAMNAAKGRSAAVAEAVEPQPFVATTIRASQPAPPVLVRRGRPAGKRSSLESVQVTAYIQAETHYAAKIALLTNSRKGGRKQDFSDLIQELLTEWLAAQG
ncbi:hypothetical protein SAMN05421770_1163 [Granulicella rosea]|uniref:Uncharacterized protein n=1 Tax=Granulicella rosea TaxID=474952 RepID=A0A239MLY4_9BACT|nr:hypothetical protein [Granulicella rosea]SNT43490.1 hypothetical protein SAMN05421770_1163 [Granulicella rosea]